MTDVSDGTHTYKAVVADMAGGESAASGGSALTEATTAPTGNITANAISTADTTPMITGARSGMAADDTVWITVNGVTYKQGIDAALTVGTTSGSLRYPSANAINANGLIDVNLHVDAALFDGAGNSKADSTQWRL